MAFNDAALTVGATAMAAAFPYMSIHTSGTISSSANESSAARLASGWTSDSDGDITIPAPLNFTGGAASGPAVRIGYWSASSGGTYGGGFMLSGDTTFNASGEYTLNSMTETGTAI